MRIHITGASGSGTTTLGAAIASEFGFEHLDADDFFWLPTDPPYTQMREKAERLSSIVSQLATGRDAVVSGSIVGWGSEIEDAFTLIIFLHLEPGIRLERLRHREMGRFGKVDPSFMEWAARYDEGSAEVRSLSMHRAWLATRKCPVLELSGTSTVAEHLEAVSQWISTHPKVQG